MTVAVCAMWRDSSAYIHRSLLQYERLATYLKTRGDSTVFVFVENDSTDDTFDVLADWAMDHTTRLFRVTDDCPYFPSKDRPDRWRHLAWVANHALDNIPDEADVVLWVESDLSYNPADMVRLIDATEEWPVVAAANLHPDGRWYDIFGTRVKGRKFQPCYPFHPEFDGLPMAVDSTGGAVAMRAAIARNTRNQPEDGYVGWCKDIRRLGFPIILDPSIRVFHGCE